jgi:hypothetical protein
LNIKLRKAMYSFIYHKPTYLHYFLLFFTALCIRSATFYFYVQHNERYRQADSVDYHVCGLCVAHGLGMQRPDGRHIFWRTPGYPCYLAPFFKYFGQPTFDFAANERAHKLSLWFQIFISSFLPIIVLLLAYTLTQSYPISIITAWLSVLHLGFVLASTYLLTDAIASIFFALFLLFYFSAFRLQGEITKRTLFKNSYLIPAALFLSAYTWMRPMGQFIALLATILLLFAHTTWRNRCSKAALFAAVFIISLLPWFIRNHQLTGKIFFCPLFGLYLNAFNAPKILARVEDIPLKDAHQKLSLAASAVIKKEMDYYRITKSPYVVCNEQLCMQSAWPLIKEHPGFFLYDWMVEVTKTTFDLYASQLVNLVANRFTWDPLVEYLDEKIAECLYKQPLPLFARLLCWLEFIMYLFIWCGIAAGLVIFLLSSSLHWATTSSTMRNLALLWLKAGLFIGVTVIQTGGFGYARLRLPLEPLILILAVTFWWWFFNKKEIKIA